MHCSYSLCSSVLGLFLRNAKVIRLVKRHKMVSTLIWTTAEEHCTFATLFCLAAATLAEKIVVARKAAASGVLTEDLQHLRDCILLE